MTQLPNIATAVAPDWTELRAQFIGGSDIAHLYDDRLDEPYLSQYDLARHKLGYFSQPKATTDRMRWGTRHEPTIIQAVREDWNLNAIGWDDIAPPAIPFAPGVAVYRCAPQPNYPNGRHFLAHPSHLGGTPDGIILAANGNHVLLEVKTVDTEAHRYWSGELPAPYILQIQTYLGLTGLKRCIVAALVGGNDLVRYDVETDPSAFDTLCAKARDWHATYIQTGTLPEYRPAADARGVFDYWTYRAAPNSTANYSDDDDACGLLDRYIEAKSDLTHAEQMLDAAKADLLDYTAGAEKITIRDYSISLVTIKPNPGRVITDADVGTTVGAKAGSTQIRITQKKTNPKKAQE